MVVLATGLNDVAAIPGLKLLWSETLGDPRVCVAVLDGPVDLSHLCFDGANVTQLPTLVSSVADQGFASQHGTHVASIIFGQPNSLVHGIAPGCRGLIVPIFTDGREGGLAPCSQIDLARAITQAVEQGANVINISGGQLAVSVESDQLLANAIRLCQENNVLIVAAAGNDGCECLHIPAALESVLAVGAMDAQGNPIAFSNWGKVYGSQGILALGEDILGASPGDGTTLKSGTSFATPVVSGIVALLLSIQLRRGEAPAPHAIREAILKSALPCNQQLDLLNGRCLAGGLNIYGAYTLITQEGIQIVSEKKIDTVMIQPSETSNPSEETTNHINESLPIPSNEVSPLSSEQPASRPSYVGIHAAEAKALTSVPTTVLMETSPNMIIPSNAVAESVTPSGADGGCGCGGGGPVQLVYALGELGTDFGTEARRDSFTQAMPPGMNLLDYLAQNPWEAQSLIWTLNLDATPIYAIVPSGAYADVTYERLRTFLRDEDIERVSVPGVIGGSVRLMSGQVVPVIVPAVRGMYSWNTSALINELVRDRPRESRDDVERKLREYLEHIYYKYRNLGITPQERARNYSGTNAFQVATVMADAAIGDLGLDSISVKKSPICRPDSDCYDVQLQFFNLVDNRRSGKVYRFTVDVSDVIPVTIGTVRSWSIAT